MFFHILKRDLKRKKTMNIILLIFIILASMFLASSVNNLFAVGGAVEDFFEVSKVPDLFTVSLEDSNQIEEYLKNSEYVTEYEVSDGYNLMNEQITIVKRQQASEKKSYERTNTFSVSAVPENFMKVFSLDGEEVIIKEGEIALPKVEAENNNLQPGDVIRIKVGDVEQEFRVSVLVKDAVFGSTFIGFKRCLICKEDFQKFAAQENITAVKTYSMNLTDISEYQKDWNQNKFNEIASITKEILSMCYIMDMLVAGILIIVSVCLILIAFLVLRFTIVFTLQEDYKEIGIMKAIGIKDAGIKELYMVKYFAISIIGAFIGFVFSFPFGDMLLKKAIVNIIVDKAEQNIIINILCAALIVAIVLLFCYLSANRLKKFSAMDAIRNGSNGERYKVKSRFKLWKQKKLGPAYYMAANDIVSNFRRFAILVITFCIGTLLILIPLSAANTLGGDDIINQFSICKSDCYLDTGKNDQYLLENGTEQLKKDLKNIELKLKEKGIQAYTGADTGYSIPCYADDPENTYNYFALQEIGSWDRSYSLLEGREPEAENEIMITQLTAKEMGVEIGDSIYFKNGDETKEFIITGSYQSLMNMGRGYRVSRKADLDYGSMSGIFCIQVEVPDMESEEICEIMKEIYPDYKVQNSKEFVNTMIGGIIDQINVLIKFIAGIVLMINSLITVLIMKTLMTKERGDIAMLKSIGFGNASLKKWQTTRILFVLVIAILTGTVLSKVLAPLTMGPIFTIMGANKIKLVVNPMEAYIKYPLLLLVVTGLSAYLCSGEIRKVDLKEVNNIE